MQKKNKTIQQYVINMRWIKSIRAVNHVKTLISRLSDLLSWFLFAHAGKQTAART